MPMVKVDLLDLKATPVQKRRLAESLTQVVSETLGYRPETVMIVFTIRSKQDIARGGKLGRGAGRESHRS